MSDAALVEDDAPVVTTGKEDTAPAVAKEAPVAAGAKDTKGGKSAASLATGAEVVIPASPSTWPESWRETMARQTLADENGVEPDKVDKKALTKEMKRLEQLTSPTAVWAKARSLESKLGSGKLVEVPGPKASAEDKAAFAKAIGVPETVEGYAETLKLANNRVLGDADKPVFESFAKALHPAGATPAIVNAATDWWLSFQEHVQNDVDEKDDTFRRQSNADLQKEWGGGFKANTAAISRFLDDSPARIKDFFAGGRTADGRKAGDDPTMLRWLADTAKALGYDSADNYGDGGSVGSNRLDEIRAMRRNEPDKYQQNRAKYEAEETALIDAEQKATRRTR